MDGTLIITDEMDLHRWCWMGSGFRGAMIDEGCKRSLEFGVWDLGFVEGVGRVVAGKLFEKEGLGTAIGGLP